MYEEGTHLMLPWFDRPIIYDVRTRPNVIQSTSGSKDLQMVGGQLRNVFLAASPGHFSSVLFKTALLFVPNVQRMYR